ncbi:hypothetical protein ACFOUP_12535 [Belliella kenyensis]|uniref:Uncharacterized protein n=1 Tax=Belliella kenyensis TaxID=1472724 RepID=A0ABV8ELM2_9BACT|nr:hypothetical protein [Belliella kenyensis]MCH7400800.1 hypothetical protein [Belliella kenyensis]MDN3601912.1 hypothetical protein [Belliella kenyensis]
MGKRLYKFLAIGLVVLMVACDQAPSLDQPNNYEVNFPNQRFSGTIPDGEYTAAYVDSDFGSGMIRTMTVGFSDGDLTVNLLIMMDGNRVLPIRTEDDDFGSYITINTMGEDIEGYHGSIQGSISISNIKTTAISGKTGFLTGEFSFSGQFVRIMEPDMEPLPVNGKFSVN